VFDIQRREILDKRFFFFSRRGEEGCFDGR
jgi:hypothetical protein